MGYKTHNNITIFPIEVYKLIPGEIGHFTSYLLCFPTKCTWGVESNPENGWQSITRITRKWRELLQKTNPSNTKHPPRNHGLVGDVRIYRTIWGCFKTRGMGLEDLRVTSQSRPWEGVPERSFAEVAWEPQEICLVTYPLVIKHSYWKWLFIVDFPIENGDFL